MIPLRDHNPRRTFPFITYTLVALNVLAFLWELSLGAQLERALFSVAFIPARYWLPGNWGFDLATIVISMFLHGGLLHIGSNMLYLWIFGDNIEDRLGHFRYLIFYLLCGFLAALSQLLLDPGSTVPMVGASGAIAGVMGAYLVLYPHSRVLMLFPFPVFLFELPAIVFLGMWFFLQFLNGIGQLPVFQQDQISGGVAFWAHVMGFITGLVLVVFMKRPERTRVEWWDTIES